MTRILASLALIAALASCAAPESELRGEDMMAPTAPAPVMAEPAAKADAEICPEAGDGIGGTGCPDL